MANDRPSMEERREWAKRGVVMANRAGRFKIAVLILLDDQGVSKEKQLEICDQIERGDMGALPKP